MDARRTVEAVWRMESARLIASLTRFLRDLGRAEEIAQDTFVAALEQWPERGVPENPGAWLMATAKHKAIDQIRRERSRDEKYAQAAADLAASGANGSPAPDIAEAGGDDLLSLLFVACHPVLPRESRVALTLRLVGGLSTDEIARAFLVPSTTLGQRLGRALTGLLPQQPEVHGLVALMELQASRFGARFGPDGEPVLLPDQDRSRWDRTLMAHGLAALDRATSLRRPLGPYTVQAAIAACHARAPSFEDTDWEAVVALYDALAQLAPSPVVELNRAVALLHADGPRAALDVLDSIGDDPRLARYHLLGAVRGDVLLRLGRNTEAAAALEGAAGLAPTQRERNLLMERAAAAMARSETE